MSEEEKEAIEYLKRHILPYYGSKGRIEFMLNDIILNLIETQQKKISLLKDQLEYVKSEYEDTIEQQQKEIEALKKENLEIRHWKYTIDTIEDLDKLKELDLIKIKGKEYISKDKIKAILDENYDSEVVAIEYLQELLEE